MIAIVHGPDALLVREAVARLVAERDPSGNATNRIDGKSTPLPQIIAQVGSVGFFGAGRVVVVNDLLARASKGGKSGDDPEASDAAAIDLAPLFAAVTPENCLIIVDPSLMSVPAAIRKIMPDDTLVTAGDPPRGVSLTRWLATVAKTAGGMIDNQTAQYLAARLYPQTWQSKPNNPRYDFPPDLDRLTQEIEKLTVASLPGPIAKRHVDSLVASVADDQVFRFTDALARRQTGPALAELEKLLLAGDEPYALVAQAMQQSELAVVLDGAAQGKDPAGIGRDLGLPNPARMSGIATSRRGQPRGAAHAEVLAAVAIDRQIKRGELRQPEDALYSLVAAASGTR